ncbi:M23 family metallopeptidase [Sulfurimonas paralvinellae]|uniref:M23 family metallopeptidase n=1 Tax=Sulfurimonas paralvinellae TaxID=317658 RepID=A0A7M1B833_9BACT|nr:M23 family metallopeptidase [Sulfurimonas paralvinellae]QOP45897.1 M23 family metallopeptidase [Sulfurimonas paralvinellae]
MFRNFLLIFLLFAAVQAAQYPKTFDTMGTPLYKASKELQYFSDSKVLSGKVKKYIQDSQNLLREGMNVDKSDVRQKKLEYLKKLRNLQKEYDYIVHLIRVEITKSIRDNDIEKFISLTSHEVDGLLSPRALREQSIKYYQKHKYKKQNHYLEKIIKEENLLERSSEEFFNQTESSQLSSHTINKKSSKNVFASVKKTKKYTDIFFTNKNLYDVTLQVKSKNKNIKAVKYKEDLFVLGADSTVRYARYYFKAPFAQYAVSYRWILGSKDARHDNNYLYRLPYAIGQSHMVSQGFNGKSTHKGHSQYAVDFMMDVGTKIYAARGGVVVKTKDNSDKHGFAKAFAKYGNYVTILHSDGTFGTYYHLKKRGVLVHTGEKVERGYPLGYSGNTGYTSGPHLHFAVFKATDKLKTRSLPIRFISTQGIVTNPKVGTYYRAK